MEKEIFTKQFPMFRYIIFAVIVKSTLELKFDGNWEKMQCPSALLHCAKQKGHLQISIDAYNRKVRVIFCWLISALSAVLLLYQFVPM
jgi:hypothetical protein